MTWFGRTKRSTAGLPARRRVRVLGLGVSYFEVGEGRPIVFLHSGLGSASAWTGVLPVVGALGRCVAIDLAGFGHSDRPYLAAPTDFELSNQQTFLDQTMELLFNDEKVILVLSGLASLMGFNWAARHPDQVVAICHMESVYRQIMWPDLPEVARHHFKLIRSAEAEDLFLHSDTIFKRMLSEQLLELPNQETETALMDAFGRLPEQRAAALAGLKDFPINGHPTESTELIKRYEEWLSESEVPKLLILGAPGYLLTQRYRNGALRLPGQRVVEVVGRHVLPLDAPNGVGRFIAAWLRTELQ